MADNIQGFIKELAFEEALTNHLLKHGWNEVIKNPTEEELVQNWANIIYDNNREIDKLGNHPLTASEMKQVMDKVNMMGSPYEMNRFINGKEVCIKRDNEADTNNYGKEVYLKIFDPMEISSGQSRYQIVRQPKFKTADTMLGDRRGNVMLLINGMPVIHIELKRSKIDVSQACYQIKRYVHEGVFQSGIFSMVQIYVAMTPEETLYFANPGKEDLFQKQFYFHWEDFNNCIVNDWKQVASNLLSIPMAHQMVGFYTIADDKDKTLKVLRSYQYFAVSRISDVVNKTNWDDHLHRGGYIWHTTGSGKTMSSFKSAQLIATSGDADKVIFLLDRIELALQSLDEYRGFAGEGDEIQDTADTSVLLAKLKSTDNDDKLIVTSIQKMSNIKEGAPTAGGGTITQELIEKIGKKRLVFIIDECHRSVFGDMLMSIKRSFPRALLFGFTGTPVFEENAKNEITTETLFGDCLHKYTIASGIPDGNVLGFDPYMVNTYNDDELRELVAFHQIDLKLKERNPDEPLSKKTTEEYLELIDKDEELNKIYDRFVNKLKMPETYTEEGKQVKGIEAYLPKNIYECDKHHIAVANDIMKSREKLSKNGKFHAMLATKNIPEAINYYKLFKKYHASLNVAAVFDSNIDNSDGGIVREDAINEMLTDYNAQYGMNYKLANYALYKKDVAKRLAHKKPYIGIENDHNQQIDLLIVVTQMLTGYDSKWINTLYVDKVMKYVDIIQAFSRTNRLFGPDKPFGTIKYYTKPYTMAQNIEDALEVYVDRPLGVFVDKLEKNLSNINQRFLTIRDIFHSHKIMNFEKLPEGREARNMFAKCFSEMTHLLEAAKLQGFVWEKSEYEFQHGNTYSKVTMELDEQTYVILLQRYRELFQQVEPADHKEPWEYAIDTYITETGTGTINADYIDSKFQRFIKNLYTEGVGSEMTKAAFEELCKTFATLSQKDQRTALIILHDIQCGDLHLEQGKTIHDYIAEYQISELKKQIMNLSEATGVNASQLINIISSDVNDQNLNEFNRFENLKLTLDLQKTRDFLLRITGSACPPFLVMPKADKILRQFILDPVAREHILLAWLHDDVTLENAAQVASGETELPTAEVAPTEDVPAEEPVPNIDIFKLRIKDILKNTLSGVAKYMRPQDEIIDSVFYVLDKESLGKLDSVGMFINKAFSYLFCKEPTIIDKHVAFNLLATKFEAYLKKLFYLMRNEEVRPRYEGDTATWKDVIHAIHPLWSLKYSEDPAYQTLYQYLTMVKDWRNNESHISPTASEQEIDVAIRIIITMYFYATGTCITELESNGHDVEAGCQAEPVHTHSYRPYILNNAHTTEHDNTLGYDVMMAAECPTVNDMDEPTRFEILKKCIIKLINFSYNRRNAVFSKQRQWEAIYRIAVDYGFAIDGDYNSFKKCIDEMDLHNLPYALSSNFLSNNNVGIYAKNIAEWTNEGLEGKELAEYEDIKMCADAFEVIVKKTIKEYKTT